MKARRFIIEIENSGGFDFNTLRRMWKETVNNRKDFRSWFALYIEKEYHLTRFVAQQVAEHYL